jgi:hypothetical protein
MIVIHDIFHAKFGQAREVRDLFKEGVALAKSSGFPALSIRLLTDLVGEPFYTFVMESTFESLADWERATVTMRGNAEWKAWYQRFIPWIDSGERKIYSVVG